MAITYKQRIPAFDAQQLEAIVRVLGDTNEGLTGPEIGHLLQDCQIPDVSVDTTKWTRLYNAFVEFQNKHQVGNHVVVFITRAMNPTSYTDCPDIFRKTRDRLNAVLALCGMEVTKSGKVRSVQRAKTLDEALERANRLRAALTQRKVHADVLNHCNAELLQGNYFHAVFWLNLWGEGRYQTLRDAFVCHPRRLPKKVTYLFDWLATQISRFLHPRPKIAPSATSTPGELQWVPDCVLSQYTGVCRSRTNAPSLTPMQVR